LKAVRFHDGRVPTSSTTRAYRSRLRADQAQQTRSTVRAAAKELFEERGWAGTSMRDIAGAAGVSVETVYANFGSKAALLGAVMDVAVVGDDARVPLGERPEFRALAEGDLGTRAAAAAALMVALHGRNARLMGVLCQAAPGDDELAALLEENRRRERVSVGQGAAAVAGRPVTDLEVDGLRAVLSHEVFLLLTGTSGWSAERYQSWVAGTIARLLADETRTP
jgi:AcrR family transcriptional regulator